MKEFGRTQFENTVYINFDSNKQLTDLFEQNLDISRIILGLEIYSGGKIDSANTLLIFDEVQEVPQALASLKYFTETAPEYSIVAAGSLLGVAMHSCTSFPVGKVEFLDLYPLAFSEFLRATEQEQYADLLKSGDYTMISSFDIVPRIRMLWNSVPADAFQPLTTMVIRGVTCIIFNDLTKNLRFSLEPLLIDLSVVSDMIN